MNDSNYSKSKKISKLKKSKKTKKEFKFDIGLAILRPILSFLVIITHCYNKNYLQGFWKSLYLNVERARFHIQIFIIISFYFTYNTLVSNDLTKKLKRFERIFIPYFLWPTIIFFLNKYLKKLFRISEIITFNMLKGQFISGYGFLFPLYFQLCLGILTIIHIIIISLFRKNYVFILIILSLISFNIQYNGMNLLYFQKSNVFKGRSVELFPFSVIGFIIAYSGIINYFKKYRFKTIIVCIYLCYLFINYDIFIRIKGFELCGIKMFIFSICIFIVFALFPSEKIKNKIIIKIIKQITNHTAGIYFIHVPVYNYTRFHIKALGQQTIKGCMMNYIICYCISLIGNFIFGKTILRHLFI